MSPIRKRRRIQGWKDWRERSGFDDITLTKRVI